MKFRYTFRLEYRGLNKQWEHQYEIAVYENTIDGAMEIAKNMTEIGPKSWEAHRLEIVRIEEVEPIEITGVEKIDWDNIGR